MKTIGFIVVLLINLPVSTLAQNVDVPEWANERAEHYLRDIVRMNKEQPQFYENQHGTPIRNLNELELGVPIAELHLEVEDVRRWVSSEDLDLLSFGTVTQYLFPLLDGAKAVAVVMIKGTPEPEYCCRALPLGRPSHFQAAFEISRRDSAEYAILRGISLGSLMLRWKGEAYDVAEFRTEVPTNPKEPSRIDVSEFIATAGAFQKLKDNSAEQFRIADRVNARRQTPDNRPASPSEMLVYEAVLEAARQGLIGNVRISHDILLNRTTGNESYIFASDRGMPDRFRVAFDNSVSKSLDKIDLSEISTTNLSVVDSITRDFEGCYVRFSPVGFDSSMGTAVVSITCHCQLGDEVGQRHCLLVCLIYRGERWEPSDYAILKPQR